MTETFPEPGWYIISQHGNDGTPGSDQIVWASHRQPCSQTQTVMGPYVTELEAQQVLWAIQAYDEAASWLPPDHSPGG
jgi:hypothetical protein